MLKTNEDFRAWLQATGPAELSALLAAQGIPEDVLTRLRQLFIERSQLKGPLDMLALSAALGQAVPALMKLAQQLPGLSQESQRKPFVVAALLALYRLLDGGETGAEGRARAAAMGGPNLSMFTSAEDMEDRFVRPLVLGAYDVTLRMRG